MSAKPSEHVEPLLEESIEIAATPAQVWALVSDLPRMAEWSPQVVKSIVRTKGPIRLGTRLLNINRRGPVVWPTRSRVTHCDPPHEIAFVVLDNRSIWSFLLTPTDDGAGTHLTQRRETPDGLSKVSMVVTKAALGGQASFTDELRRGMRKTLQRVKADAER